MAFRIRAGDSGTFNFEYVQQFVIEDDALATTHYVNAVVRQAVAAVHFRNRDTRELDSCRLKQALAIHTLPIVEASLRDGSLSGEEQRLDIRLDDRQLEHAVIGLKSCRYRIHDRGDDYCDAGWSREQGGRTRLAASRTTCDECPAPDARLVCSNLHHLRLSDTSSMTGRSITVVGDECDWNRPHNSPAQCSFGLLDCWERRVEAAPRSTLSLPPLAIHESIDFLGAVWLNTFKRPLLTMSVLAPGGVLAAPCSGSQDFQAKLSALYEVFNSLSIEHTDPKVTGTIALMRSKLRSWGEGKGASPEDLERMDRAVDVLQRAIWLRAGQHHGAARDRFEKAVSDLGLTMPPASYADEWNRLQTVLHDALSELRQFIRERV